MMKRRFLTLFCIAFTTLFAGVLSADAQTRVYGGRATGVVVISPTASMAGDTGPLSPRGGSITVAAPSSAQSGITTGAIVSSVSGAGNASQASSTVNNIRILAGGYVITAMSSTATSQCICCPGSAEPGCTGTASSTGVVVTDPAGNNVPVVVTGQANQVVTLANGAGTITFNEQVAAENQLTTNAIHVNITSGGTTTNAVIASATASIVCGSLGPSPAGVTVAGRVVTAGGQGIAGATVILTNSAGVARSVAANATGNFSFSDVTAGQSYVVDARAKSFTFPTQIIEVNDEINDLEIRANP